MANWINKIINSLIHFPSTNERFNEQFSSESAYNIIPCFHVHLCDRQHGRRPGAGRRVGPRGCPGWGSVGGRRAGWHISTDLEHLVILYEKQITAFVANSWNNKINLKNCEQRMNEWMNETSNKSWREERTCQFSFLWNFLMKFRS